MNMDKERVANANAIRFRRHLDPEKKGEAERVMNSEAVRNSKLIDPVLRPSERETDDAAMLNCRSTQGTVRKCEENALEMQRRTEITELLIHERPTLQGRPTLYSDIFKSTAKRYDRRVTRRPFCLLFMTKKIELLKLSISMLLCFRKKRIHHRIDSLQ
ncbi:unnamed protein product [Gongylonema pulchrum]|uniref:IBB domain-containing protein n=1 Tax=Gongylonema pulchrum TaxID=637853 RepID=A0A183E4C8_9BILA|nr:unnamed protein product [Gongylonema pulchrum]